MLDFAEQHRIPVLRCGKLVAATRRDELPRLMALYDNAVANGTKGVSLLADAEACRRVAPWATGAIAGIHSPATACIDFAQVARTIATTTPGVEVIPGFELARVSHINTLGGDVSGIGTNDSAAADAAAAVRLQDKDGRAVTATTVISAAGNQAGQVSAMLGGAEYPRTVAIAGVYRRLKASTATEHGADSINIYPVPDPSLPFLGVHITPTVHGDVILGPTALPHIPSLLSDPKSAWLVARLSAGHVPFGASQLARSLSRAFLAKDLSRFAPWLGADGIDPDWSVTGLRAQAIGPGGRLVDDFAWEWPSGNVLNVRNAPSPAATSSLAIAEAIADEVGDRFAQRIERARKA